MDQPVREIVDPDPVWERRHPSQPESWSFDFVSTDSTLAGFVALTLWPSRRPAWYWAALVGKGRPYLLVRDLDVAPPRSSTSREIRSEALWADMNCETPHDHWSLGLEAFGVALDDPDEALGAERGDRFGLGLDLEWEADGAVVGGGPAYAQACRVHGEILLGAGSEVETVELDDFGWRGHSWGPAVGWFEPRSCLAGRLDDGVAYRTDEPSRLDVGVVHRAPLRLEWHGERATLERELCRFRTSTGRSGLGWSERVAPG